MIQNVVTPNGQIQTVQVVENKNGTTTIIDSKGNIFVALKAANKNKRK